MIQHVPRQNLTRVAALLAVMVLLGSRSLEAAKKTQVAELALDEIARNLDRSLRNRWFNITWVKHIPFCYDRALVEIVRRGGPEAEEILSSRLKQQDAEMESAGEGTDGTVIRKTQRHIETLTALRRVRGQRDPLGILLDVPDDLKLSTRSLPSLDVEMMSLDVDAIPIQVTTTGSWTTRRPECWRVEVRDENGECLPWRALRSDAESARTSAEVVLKSGESIKTRVNLNHYINVLPPGKYTVTLLYHNLLSICDASDSKLMDDIICFRSQPFHVTVEPPPKHTIHLHADSRARSRGLIRELDSRALVKFFSCPYDRSVDKFIAPESPEGQLLRMGWEAVPEMLDSVVDGDASLQQKAWCFALLYSIAQDDLLNPARFQFADTLPAYVWQKANGETQFWLSRRRPNAHKQQFLAEQWMEFKESCLDIREFEDGVGGR